MLPVVIARLGDVAENLKRIAQRVESFDTSNLRLLEEALQKDAKSLGSDIDVVCKRYVVERLHF